MLRKLIVKIRRQSKPVKDNIALAFAGVFTAFVFSIWAYHLPARMAEYNREQGLESKPLTDAFDQFSEQVAAVREALPKERTYEPPPAYIDTTNGGTYFTPTTTASSSDMTYSSTSSSTELNVAESRPVPKPVRIITTENNQSVATSSAE